MSDNFRLALDLAAAGFPVLPCRPKDEVINGSTRPKKAPRVTKWQESGSTNAAQIRRWWSKWPDSIAGICLPLDKKTLVIDCDGPEALDYFRRVCVQYGGLPDLPATLRVKSPHGHHFYFAVSPAQWSALDTEPRSPVGYDFETGKGEAGTKVDIRGAGSQIIAPGNLMPDGSEYACQVPADMLREAMAPLPEWLFARLLLKSAARNKLRDSGPAGSLSVGTPGAGVQGLVYAINAGRKTLQAIAAMQENTGRNQAIRDAAYQFGGYVGAGFLSYESAESLLMDAATKCGELWERPRDTQAAITSGLDKGSKTFPRYEPNPDDCIAAVYRAGGVPFCEITDRLRQDKTLREFSVIAGNTQTQEEARAVPPFVSVSDSWAVIESALQSDPEPIKTGIDGLDRALGGGLRPGLTILGANPACGKSALMIQAADHIAAMGRPVLFYALEMTARELSERSILRETLPASLRLSALQRLPQCGDLSFAPAAMQQTAAAIKAAILGRFDAGDWVGIRGDVAASVAEAKRAHLAAAGNRLFIRDSAFGYDNPEGVPTVEGIIEDVEAFIAANPDALPVVIVDYIQLLHCRDRAQDRSEYDRMGAVSIALKRLSVRGFPVVVVSSFARSAYYSRPDLDSFKGSGNLEYTASAALVLGYRESVSADQWAKGDAYNHAVADKYRGEDPVIPAALEIRCVKARNFKPSCAELAYYGPFYRFETVRSMEGISSDEVANRYRRWAAEQTIRTKADKAGAKTEKA